MMNAACLSRLIPKPSPSKFQTPISQESLTIVEGVDLQVCHRRERVKHPWKQRRQGIGLKVPGFFEGTARIEAEKERRAGVTHL